MLTSIGEDDSAMCPSLVPCGCQLSDYSLHDVYGEILPNNSYMDLRLMSNPLSGGEGVQCHTDLTTCCSSDQDMDRGDWYAPDSEDRLPLEREEIVTCYL